MRRRCRQIYWIWASACVAWCSATPETSLSTYILQPQRVLDIFFGKLYYCFFRRDGLNRHVHHHNFTVTSFFILMGNIELHSMELFRSSLYRYDIKSISSSQDSLFITCYTELNFELCICLFGTSFNSVIYVRAFDVCGGFRIFFHGHTASEISYHVIYSWYVEHSILS